MNAPYVLVMTATLSAIAAICSVCIAFLNWHQARIGARRQFNSELRRWVNNCLETLVEFEHCCSNAFDDKDTNHLLAKMSSLIEQGRMFFPNVSFEYRPRILDWLIYSYHLLQQLPTNKTPVLIRKTLASLRKQYRTDAQIALDIKQLNTTLKDWQLYLKSEWHDPSQSHPVLENARNVINNLSETQGQLNAETHI